MHTELITEMSFTVLGGLAIFLLGMKNMSEGLQAIAGDRLRSLINAVTNNRFMATGIGALMTCIIQSSSVTTVMVVGMVNSGFMTLVQAVGVIMGANIGTTITGWILVLSIGKYGLPILAMAAFFYLFSKNEKWRYLGMAVMGIGMVFFGLELMKNGFKPIRNMPEFIKWFSTFSAHSYFGVIKCILAGAILTMVVQSSSATIGITMGLASTGVIPFETAAGLVLGENIGTTVTAYLSSIGTTTNAKRAAYAHIVFNVVGVIWISILFSPYLSLVRAFLGTDPNHAVLNEGIKTFPYIIAGIAAVHTGFNVTNTILFMPFTGYLASFLNKIVPDKSHKEAPHLSKYDIRFLETPITAIEQSRVEIVKMGEYSIRMMEYMKSINNQEKPDEVIIKKLFHREEILDIIQKEIMVFLTGFFSESLPVSVINEGRLQMRIADEYESVGDCIAAIMKLHLRLKNAGKSFESDEMSEIDIMHEAVYSYIKLVSTAYKERHTDIISKARIQGDAITHQFRELRSRQVDSLSRKNKDPLAGTICMDILNTYRRTKDHVLNVAEALAGEK